MSYWSAHTHKDISDKLYGPDTKGFCLSRDSAEKGKGAAGREGPTSHCRAHGLFPGVADLCPFFTF